MKSSVLSALLVTITACASFGPPPPPASAPPAVASAEVAPTSQSPAVAAAEVVSPEPSTLLDQEHAFGSFVTRAPRGYEVRSLGGGDSVGMSREGAMIMVRQGDPELAGDTRSPAGCKQFAALAGRAFGEGFLKHQKDYPFPAEGQTFELTTTEFSMQRAGCRLAGTSNSQPLLTVSTALLPRRKGFAMVLCAAVGDDEAAARECADVTASVR